MIRINLLPHRAEKRRILQTQFAVFAGLSFLLGAVIVGLVHFVIGAQLDAQMRRNQYLQQEINKLDTQIADIRKLREQTNSLLARKTVVEDLQGTRADVVHLLDQMLRLLPDGVYLKSIRQTGNQINLVGYAQTNARVSTLMRSLEDSLWLESPALVEIHATTANGVRVSEFTLNFSLTRQTSAGGKAEQVHP
ncbi:MAG: PilN domain-containing protein [Nitrosomonadales bacterium]|nr:PilN domain-containing protein [Nitrosomonadales bacterium]